MAKLTFERLEAEERAARYDTTINSLRDKRNIISETNSIISLRRLAHASSVADYIALKAEALGDGKGDYSDRLKHIPVIHIGDAVYHPCEPYSVLERAIQKRELEIMKLFAQGHYTDALKEEGDYLFELGYSVRSTREYDDLQSRLSRLYAERDRLLDHLSGENALERVKTKIIEQNSVKNMVKKLAVKFPNKTEDEVLWHIADKVNKEYETIKAAYYFREKKSRV